MENKTKRQGNMYLPLAAMIPVAAVQSAGPAGVDVGLAQFILSALLVAVVIGVAFTFWKTTREYGGIIGEGIRRVGAGMLFLIIEALDRITTQFGHIGLIDGLVSSTYVSAVHDLILLLALLFVALGFIKFSQAAAK